MLMQYKPDYDYEVAMKAGYALSNDEALQNRVMFGELHGYMIMSPFLHDGATAAAFLQAIKVCAQSCIGVPENKDRIREARLLRRFGKYLLRFGIFAAFRKVFDAAEPWYPSQQGEPSLRTMLLETASAVSNSAHGCRKNQVIFGKRGYIPALIQILMKYPDLHPDNDGIRKKAIGALKRICNVDYLPNCEAFLAVAGAFDLVKAIAQSDVSSSGLRDAQKVVARDARTLSAALTTASHKMLLTTTAAQVEAETPLAGGYKVGDRVVSKFAFTSTSGSVHVGDEGTVQGPSNDPGVADADQRLNCAFPEHCGINMLLTTLCLVGTAEARLYLPGAQLVGGYKVGDKVVSKASCTTDSGSVQVGDEGTVKGPSSALGAADADQHLNCAFPKHCGINMRLTSLCQVGTAEARLYLLGAQLVGGYKVGDKVVSKIAFTGVAGSFKCGDEGTVKGPSSDPSCADADQRMNCVFPAHNGINLLPSHICRQGTAEAQLYMPGAQLVGGYKVGDKVLSKSMHTCADGSLHVGDEGTVKGPSSNATDADQRMYCVFPAYNGINVLPTQVCRKGTAEAQLYMPGAQLAGGYKVGDKVVSLITFSSAGVNGGSVQVGDEGTVKGPSSSFDATDADQRMNCVFPAHNGVNVLPSHVCRKGTAAATATAGNFQIEEVAAGTLEGIVQQCRMKSDFSALVIVLSLAYMKSHGEDILACTTGLEQFLNTDNLPELLLKVGIEIPPAASLNLDWNSIFARIFPEFEEICTKTNQLLAGSSLLKLQAYTAAIQ
eukprot:COSAG01_NODE_5190_length_4422_cov_4.461022_1_plen_776_part_10